MNARETFLRKSHGAFELVIALKYIGLELPFAKSLPIDKSSHPGPGRSPGRDSRCQHEGGEWAMQTTHSDPATAAAGAIADDMDVGINRLEWNLHFAEQFAKGRGVLSDAPSCIETFRRYAISDYGNCKRLTPAGAPFGPATCVASPVFLAASWNFARLNCCTLPSDRPTLPCF
jgi:hypothetical protein